MRFASIQSVLVLLSAVAPVLAGAPADGIRVLTLNVDAEAGKTTVSRGDTTQTLAAKPGDVASIDLGKLGLVAGERYVGFQAPAGLFVPPFTGALKLTVDATPTHTISLCRVVARPVVVSASFHVSEDATDLADVKWDAATSTLSGTSRVLAEFPYERRLVAPPEPKAWKLAEVKVAEDDTKAGASVEHWQSGPWVGIVLKVRDSREVKWSARFEQQATPGATTASVTGLRATALSHRLMQVTWKSTGFCLVRRGEGTPVPVGSGMLLDRDVSPETSYTYHVSAISWSGGAQAAASVTVRTPGTPPPPPKPDLYISDIQPLRATVGWNDRIRNDLSIEDNPIRIAGKRYTKGVGVHAVSEIVYVLKPSYERFVAHAGVDDEKDGQGTVVFEVYADGRLLYRTGTLRGGQPAEGINVPIPAGAKQLRLVVGDGGDGVGCDHADWAEAGFVMRK